jgi:cytochrome c-type biogenesis protein CcmH/NrfG
VISLSPRQPAERLILAALAFCLLIFGLPQAAESLIRLAGRLDETPPASAQSQISPAQSHQAAQLERLDDKFGDPHARTNAGLLRLRLAVRQDASLDKEMAEQAVEDLRQGLARAPANPLAWTALAHADFLLGDAGEARKALALTLSVAPFEPALTLARCQVGLALWSELSETERNQVARQIENAWAAQPQELLALARGDGKGNLIAAALEDPAQRKAFERALGGS